MMALEPPFAHRCDSYAAVVSAVLHSPPMTAPKGYSDPLGSTLQKLLARKPHHRPSDVVVVFVKFLLLGVCFCFLIGVGGDVGFGG